MGLAGFLLFLVQPMLAKFILPWFGGSATTWTVCMLFFQAALLLGYAYAYAVTRPLPLAAQVMLQILLVGAACLFLPITPSEGLKPLDSTNPTFHILGLLAVCVGAPYAVLATTSPLLQRWLDLVEPDILASRFFAVSNLGSFLGLLSYPFAVEPFLSSPRQTALWSAGFVLFALLLVASAAVVLLRYRMRGRAGGAIRPAETEPDRPEGNHGRWWLVYSTLGSILLLATTNRITQWSAVIPFLWILPLSVYLLTFVLCFGHQVSRWRRSFLLAFVAMAALCALLSRPELPEDLLLQVGLQCLTLFFGCMICHGEIVRLQPPAGRLPHFYLVVALGGALGGALVTLAAPVLFSDYWEHPLAILAIVLVGCHQDLRLIAAPGFAWSKVGLAATFGLFVVGVGAGGRAEWVSDAVTIDRARNFYGVVKVYREDIDDPREYSLVMQQAGVDQGSQYQAADRRRTPSCAFDEKHGLGFALRYQRRRRDDGDATPLRVGIIGLGAGMTAAQGKTGDYFRYYELNPAVTTLAHRYFTYLADSPAKIDILEGDGRILLEREAQTGQLGRFDVLIIDAFRGAAPPMHLMTKEAFDVYLRHLAPDGILAINFELDTFELAPLHRGLAAALGLQVHWFESAEGTDCEDPVSWALYSRDDGLWTVPEVKAAISPWRDQSDSRLLWTDANSNLLSVINWGADDD
jgi:hypothetical protein